MVKKKIRYEKPKSMDIGKAGAVLGAVCSEGNLASDGCPQGINPNSAFYCEGGSVADSYCGPSGGVAGFPGCFAGTTPA